MIYLKSSTDSQQFHKQRIYWSGGSRNTSVWYLCESTVRRLWLAYFGWLFKHDDQNLSFGLCISDQTLYIQYAVTFWLYSVETLVLTAALVNWMKVLIRFRIERKLPSPEATVTESVRNSQENYAQIYKIFPSGVIQYLRDFRDITVEFLNSHLTCWFWPSAPTSSILCSNLWQCTSNFTFCSVFATSLRSQKGFVGVKAFALRWRGQYPWGRESSLLKHFLISSLHLCVSVLLHVILHSSPQSFSSRTQGSAGFGHCVDLG